MPLTDDDVGWLLKAGPKPVAAKARDLSPIANQVQGLGPVDRTVQYSANRLFPNTGLSADQAIELYHSGYITWETCEDILLVNGVSINPGIKYNIAARHWQGAVMLRRSKPSEGEVLDLYLRNKITRTEADQRLSELGFSQEKERDLLLKLDTEYSPGLIFELYQRSAIDDVRAKELLRTNGFLSNLLVSDFLDRPTPHNLGDVYQWYTRGIASKESCHELLKRLGHRSQQEREELLGLSSLIPGPSDLVRFVVKDVFDEGTVSELGLDDEYNLQKDRYEFWCKANGLGEMTLPGNPDGRPINWPQMYYRANWQIISPTQAYQMLHRLRPNRVQNFRSVIPELESFRLANMRQVLKAADYPSKMRDWLTAISYNVLTRTDTRRMYDIGVLGSKVRDRDFEADNPISEAKQSPAGRELFEMFQDQGYNPEDAAKLTLFTVTEERTRRSKAILGQARARIAEAYRIGLLSWEQAAIRLYRLRLDDPVLRAEYDRRFEAERLAIARNDPSVMAGLSQLDFEADLQIAKESIAVIKKQYTRGILNRNQAETELHRIGVDRFKIARYLDAWKLSLGGGGKPLALAQLVKLARLGFISERILDVRLTNLGYSPEDILHIKQLLQYDVNLDLLRQQERAAKTEQQRLAAIARQIREAERQRERAVQRLARSGSPSQLERWVVRGILPPRAMLERLLRLDWPVADARAKVAEATQKLEERIRREGGRNGQA